MNDQNQINEKLTLKDVYQKIGINYRYFLNWRHRLLAGFLATIAVLGLGFKWLFKEAPDLLWILFSAGFVLSLVFWILDYRNRDLYHACQKSGEACEKHLPDGVGIYMRLNTLKRNWLTHSRAFEILIIIVCITMIRGIFWALLK